MAQASVGTLEFRCVSEPIRTLRSRNFRYVKASASALDTAAQRVRCCDDNGHESEIAYDTLIIATGAQGATFGVPGVAEHAHQLRTLADARRIREHVLESLERASTESDERERARLLHFVCVGGGPTAIEYASELSDLLRQDAASIFPELARHWRITVLEAGDEILGSFDRSLSQYARRLFGKRGISVRTRAKVVAVNADSVDVDIDGARERLACDVKVWSTGVTATAFTRSLGFQTADRDRIAVDEHLRVLGVDNVYAIGDCSGTHLPATAQAANQEGKYLAKVLNGATTKPFKYSGLGSLCYVGGYRALYDFNKNFRVSGVLAFLLWRSAYFTRTVSWANKLLIPMFWFKTFWFGRDVTKF